MKDKEEIEFYKDRLGRGWVVTFYDGPTRCFNVHCGSKAHYSMARTTNKFGRREFICYRCFGERKQSFGLEINQTRFS